jgi:hypothetical protein
MDKYKRPTADATNKPRYVAERAESTDYSIAADGTHGETHTGTLHDS